MCGFNEGGDIFHQVCTVTEMISDSKVKLKTLVDVTCGFLCDCHCVPCEYFRNPQIFFHFLLGSWAVF